MQFLLSEPQIFSSVKNSNACLKGLLSVSQELILRKFLSECLVHAINIMRTTYNFISLEGKAFPAVSTSFFKESSLILTNQQSLSLKSILDTKASIFTISGISTCDWCGGRDGGCSSLDCYTCDSPWYCFLFSSAIFLRDITRCETPGMYKWVPGLSGWEGSAGWLPFILQLTRPLKFCCSVGFLTINIRWLKVMAPEIRFGP